jgi:DNA-binding transcriptional MocR family regulator
VSIGTVTRAYVAAGQRGLLRGRAGRGTFVSSGPASALGLPDPAAADGAAVQMDMSWPLHAEDPDLRPVLRSLLQDGDLAQLLRYQPNAGMGRHRAAGASWIARSGIHVDARRVVVCAGAQHAILVLLASLAEPGDTILCEELTYPGFRAAAELLHLKLLGLPMDAEGLLPQALESACRAKRARALYCTPSIHNPTTGTLSPGRRAEVARIAARHGLPIIEDAALHMLLDEPPRPLAELAPEVGYFLAGPSKVVAGGLRIAFLAVPAAALERVTRAIWASCWMAPPLNAEIFARWIEDGTADAAVRRKKAEAAARIALARQVLAGQRLRSSPSGYHAWLELPPGWDGGAAFAAAAARRGASVTPAEAFFVGSGAPPRAVRISVTAASTRDALARGLERLAALLQRPNALGTPIV